MAQQKTSVNFLVDIIKLKYDLDLYHVKKEIEQANQMFEEQIIEAHLDGQSLVSCDDIYAKQYYTDTYIK
jgi:hypothetical protein